MKHLLNIVTALGVMVGCNNNFQAGDKALEGGKGKPESEKPEAREPEEPPQQRTDQLTASDDPVAKTTDDDPVKALAFTSYTLLKGVTAIHSATKIWNQLYFTGTDREGNSILGKIKPDETRATLLPVGRLSDGSIMVKGKLTLVTNTDDALYLTNDLAIFRVDVLTERVESKTESRCHSRSTFLKNSRLNTVNGPKLVICGLVDGSEIESELIVDGYTGDPLEPDNYSSYSFDSAYIWRYRPEARQLVKYDGSFVRQEVYAVSSYRQNSTSAAFVSDSNGGMWFFGCDSTGCYVSRAKVQEQ